MGAQPEERWSAPVAELEAGQVVAWLRQQPAFRAPRHGDARRIPCGFATLDALLGGGLPRGAISELAGPGGRTSLALAILGAATRRGETVAWVDAANALDPRSARGAGVDAARLLWVRPEGERRERLALKAADLILDAGGFAFVVLDLTEAETPTAGGPRRTPSRRRRRGRDRSAWWVRLARKVEGTPTVLLCIGDVGSFCSVLRLHCERGAQRAGFEVRVQIERRRNGPAGGSVSLALAQPVD